MRIIRKVSNKTIFLLKKSISNNTWKITVTNNSYREKFKCLEMSRNILQTNSNLCHRYRNCKRDYLVILKKSKENSKCNKIYH